MNKSLQYLSVEGNPLGKVGLSLLMKAKTRNIETNFTLNIKLAEGESDSAVDFKVQIFNHEKPEGPYSLDLTKIYDQLVLQKLLTISSNVAKASVESGAAAPIDQKTCFHQVKLNGKAKWEVPTAVTPEGLWDLGPEPTGNLVFTFTQDPAEYKKEQSKINKEAAAMDPE